MALMCAKNRVNIFGRFQDIRENVKWPRFYWTTRVYLSKFHSLYQAMWDKHYNVRVCSLPMAFHRHRNELAEPFCVKYCFLTSRWGPVPRSKKYYAPKAAFTCRIRWRTRGVQKVLQLDHKKERKRCKLHFIFQHNLYWVQCICDIFLADC